MITLNHVAITCNDRKKTRIFFEKILEFSKQYDFKIESSFTKALFDVEKEIIIDVYMNDYVKIEVFIIDTKVPNFNHICLNVNNINDVIGRCKKYNLPVKIAYKNDKKIVFIRDFCGNYYELKE